MKRILTALVLIAAVLSILFAGPVWTLATAAAVVALLGLLEFRVLALDGAVNPQRLGEIPLWWLSGSVLVLFASTLTLPDDVLPVLSSLALLLFTVNGLRLPFERVLPSATAGAFGLVYVVYTMSLTVLIRQHEDGKGLLLFLLVCVWSGDIAALYIGKLIGKHKLAPRLSPNKTVEGSLASIAGSMLFGMGVYYAGQALDERGIGALHIGFPAWQMLLLAIGLNIAAQVGDLLESAIKRGAGVKDSGTMLPGHGGVLDRIDALLLAAPVLWYVLVVRDWFTLVR